MKEFRNNSRLLSPFLRIYDLRLISLIICVIEFTCERSLIPLSLHNLSRTIINDSCGNMSNQLGILSS